MLATVLLALVLFLGGLLVGRATMRTYSSANSGLPPTQASRPNPR